MTTTETPQPIVVTGCDVLVRPGDLREDVDLQIAGGRIAATAPARGGRGGAGVRTIDGRGLLAMPGLVNAHTHSPENCLRGSGEGLPLEPWLARMFGTSGPFDADAHYTCAVFGAIEMVLTGTTSVVDHVWMTPPSLPALDAVMRAYRDVGLRAAVAPLVADRDFTGDLAGALGVDVTGALFTDFAGAPPVEELQGLLEEAIDRWHGAEGGRLRVFAGPCGLQWCSDELLVALAETAERNGTCTHLHLLESPLQVPVCRQRFPGGAVRDLDRLGLLGPRTSLAHGVHLDDADIALIADRRAVVVHNPSANMRLGSGRARVVDLLGAGVTVALGADGSVSSDNQVLWSQMRLAALVHNDGFDLWISSDQALDMATSGGARALGLEGELGTLEPGRLADVILVDRRELGLAGAQRLETGLVLSETGRAVRHVIVDGRLVVSDGRCLGVDVAGAIDALAAERDHRAALARAPSAGTRAAMAKLDHLRRVALGRGVDHG